MAVTGRRSGIEALGEFVLGLWGETRLVFDYDDLVFVKSVVDEPEVFICKPR